MHFQQPPHAATCLYRVEQKNLAKFSDTCSVRAEGLCIGCIGQWAERGRENSNMQEFFRMTLYVEYGKTNVKAKFCKLLNPYLPQQQL